MVYSFHLNTVAHAAQSHANSTPVIAASTTKYTLAQSNYITETAVLPGHINALQTSPAADITS
jgi:hypothetical protein